MSCLSPNAKVLKILKTSLSDRQKFIEIIKSNANQTHKPLNSELLANFAVNLDIMCNDCNDNLTKKVKKENSGNRR